MYQCHYILINESVSNLDSILYCCWLSLCFCCVQKWKEGQVGFLIRKSNVSWVQQKWGASVVQLDPNTWVLEYRRSSVYESSRLHSAVLEFFKDRISRVVGRLKKELWLFAVYGDLKYTDFTANYGIKVPT